MTAPVSWLDAGNFVFRIAIAYGLALPIGWERETQEEGMGVRTFPLVAMASCAFLLLGDDALGGTPEVRSRLIQGLMTGIGFIGGGAILKGAGAVHGTATAASIWNTAVIGAAVALGRVDMAIVLSVLNLLTLRLLIPLKQKLGRSTGDRGRDR